MKKSNLFAKVQDTIDKTLETRKAVRKELLQGMKGEKLEVAKYVLCDYGIGKVRSTYDGKFIPERQEMERNFHSCFEQSMWSKKINDFYCEQIFNAKEIEECAKITGSFKMYIMLEDVLKKQDFSWELRDCLINKFFSLDEILVLPKDKILNFYSMCCDSFKNCLRALPEVQREKFLKLFSSRQQSLLREEMEFMDYRCSEWQLKYSKREVFLRALEIFKNK